MERKKNLLDEIKEAVETEECCMECLLAKILEMIDEDTSCDEELKQALLTIISHGELCNRCKLKRIMAFIGGYDN